MSTNPLYHTRYNPMKTQVFPVGDAPCADEKEALGLDRYKPVVPNYQKNIGAIAIRERRKPREGEWYLSGAVISAYRARADMDTEYQIARLVRVRTETKTTMEISEEAGEWKEVPMA